MNGTKDTTTTTTAKTRTVRKLSALVAKNAILAGCPITGEGTKDGRITVPLNRARSLAKEHDGLGNLAAKLESLGYTWEPQFGSDGFTVSGFISRVGNVKGDTGSGGKESTDPATFGRLKLAELPKIMARVKNWELTDLQVGTLLQLRNASGNYRTQDVVTLARWACVYPSLKGDALYNALVKHQPAKGKKQVK